MRYIIAVLLLIIATASHAEMNVAATTTTMGMIAREVGGDVVNVTDLTPPDRDVHFLQARPSIMAGVRRADLLIAMGAELEVGWLPAAIQGANNRRVYPGQPGYFEAAQHIELIEVGGPADRGLGDVHPEGNPHFNLDPVRVGQVALALAEHMGTMNPERSEYFRGNAERFVQEIDERMPQWRARTEGAIGILSYHRDVNYLASRFDVPLLGSIEPLPGVPPTARHLRDLVSQMRDREGTIVYMIFQPERGPRFMAEQLGWPTVTMRLEPPLGSTANDFFDHIDAWVGAISGEST